MAYNTKQIVKDKDGNPISQYYNPVTDQYEPVEGNSGGNKVVVQNNDLSLIPILDKLSQLTGTVLDEETRKTNEGTRQSNETLRVSTETSRKNAENTRVTSEKDRVTKETDRATNELDRVAKEKVRVTSETTRVNAEDARKANETDRVNSEDIRKSNELLRIQLYELITRRLNDGYFKGEKGDTGNGLEFNWRETELGVRVVGQTNYVYVNLKGEKGDTGSIENLTKKHVTDALGYTPPITDTITTINSKTGAITKEDIVALGIPASDTNTTYTEITTAEIDVGTATTLRAITGRRVKYILDKVQSWISTITKADIGLANVNNIKQMPSIGGTFEGIVKAHPNTSNTVAQIRNITLSTGDAVLASMGDGDIWIKYK